MRGLVIFQSIIVSDERPECLSSHYHQKYDNNDSGHDKKCIHLILLP